MIVVDTVLYSVAEVGHCKALYKSLSIDTKDTKIYIFFKYTVCLSLYSGVKLKNTANLERTEWHVSSLSNVNKFQYFPRLLPIGGFWSWKLDSFVGKGAVRFVGVLKFKLAVGGFKDDPTVILEADGGGIVFPQTYLTYRTPYSFPNGFRVS